MKPKSFLRFLVVLALLAVLGGGYYFSGLVCAGAIFAIYLIVWFVVFRTNDRTIISLNGK